MQTAAKDLQIGNEIEFQDDLHEITFIEQAEATDGNNEPLVNLYLDGITGAVPVARDRSFLTFSVES